MDWLWYLLAGALAGILSGMGMGGGTVLIPLLTIFLGVSQRGAQSANMLAFLPGALAAILIHRKDGRLNFKAGIPLLISGALGAVAGALVAAWVSADWLKKGFGGFLIVLAVIQWRAGEKPSAKP